MQLPYPSVFHRAVAAQFRHVFPPFGMRSTTRIRPTRVQPFHQPSATALEHCFHVGRVHVGIQPTLVMLFVLPAAYPPPGQPVLGYHHLGQFDRHQLQPRPTGLVLAYQNPYAILSGLQARPKRAEAVPAKIDRRVVRSTACIASRFAPASSIEKGWSVPNMICSLPTMVMAACNGPAE